MGIGICVNFPGYLGKILEQYLNNEGVIMERYFLYNS
jgi:hypothetical protein